MTISKEVMIKPNKPSTAMKTEVCILAFLAVLTFVPGMPAQETFRGGIVYGPKAAFKIDAPEGWVLDNKSGAKQGLPCVLYPKGSSWADAKTIIYAKIASTEFEDVNEFVAWAIKGMKAKHGTPKEKIASGKTQDGRDYFINEYPATKTYSQWERVGYVQLPHAVAYIVLSSRDKTSYSKDAPALEKVLKTLVYLEPKSDQVSPSAASASPVDAPPSRFASLTDAAAEAKRLRETEAGKLYDFDFNTIVSNRLTDVVGQCAKDSKPLIFDLVFVFAGDGHVAQVLQPPDSTVAACVASKLGDLRLRAPPQPDWPVEIHIELNTRVKAEKADAAGKQYPREPAVITQDRELSMKAGRAEMNKNYEEALALYEKAIKVKGNFAPFVYQNRGMLYLNRAKASQDRQSKIADLQRAIADFKTSIELGAASKDQLNRGLEKFATRANLDEATKLLEEENRK
jgi:tetratricopeptide (TPR) repeat protein